MTKNRFINLMNNRIEFTINLCCVLLVLVLSSCSQIKQGTLLFVGGFTDKVPGRGIAVYIFDTNTGEAELKFSIDTLVNTSFLKVSNNGRYLYSVTESQMPYHGKILAYRVDSTHKKLEFINQEEVGGRNPAHIELEKEGQTLLCSNYSDPSLSVFTLNPDGSLNPYHQLLKFKDSSIVKNRQSSAHIHSSNYSIDQEYVFIQDLGADKIRGFKSVKKKGRSVLMNMNDVKVKPGSGPRHFTFHPNNKFAYGVTELTGEINAYSFNNGDLKLIETKLSYQNHQELYRAADIHISPDGSFLYASNRGPEENSISVFSINHESGKLTLMQHIPTYGEHPRNFVIDPSGNYVLVGNQFTNSIVVFKRDLQTGKLKKTPKEIPFHGVSSLQMKTYEY